MRLFLYIVLLGCFFISCKKASERSCLKATGGGTTQLIEIQEDFDTLYLYDAIEYILIQDTVNQLQLTGGENLLPHISNKVTNHKLSIRNDNNCNFIRSFKKKIKVKIHFKKLNYIHFEGSEPLKTLDTITSNSLRVKIRDGAGSVTLKVAVGYLETTISHGFGDFTLAGTAQNTFLYCNSNSFCDALKLHTSEDLIVRSNTQGDMLINAAQANLKATILRGGNIKFIGTPLTKEVNISGEGDLIDLEN